VKRVVLVFFMLVLIIGDGSCCMSDPFVTIIFDVTVDMDLLKLLKHEGFSFDLVEDVIPSFGEEGRREYAVYKGHYGLCTAMVASDMVVLKVHEEKYDWKKGVKTELLFLQTIGVLKGTPDINIISMVASWESKMGKNLFLIPEGVEFVSFENVEYPVKESVMTDYFSFLDQWIAVPGNATLSVEGNVLTILLLRCGGEITADTSKLSIFAPFREVLLVCNSIDYEETGKELKTILTEKGYIVRRITPGEFDVYRWFSPRIILLGGHQSPEGMGEVVSRILTESEKKMIEKTGPFMFGYENIDFRKQGIIILAGADREGTHDITMSRIPDIIMWLESV
jgi:hypothetical protein